MDQIASSRGQGSSRGVVVKGGAGAVQDYRDQGRGYPDFPRLDLDAEEVQGFDLRKYLNLFWKHKIPIAAIMLTCLVVGLVVTLMMTPVYRATSSIQIDRETKDVTNLKDSQGDDTFGSSQEFFQTQYELLGSMSLAERVVNSLALADDPAFGDKPKNSLASGVMNLVFGKPAETEQASEISDRTRKVAEDIKTNYLSISPVRNSRIVKINVDSTDPALAQRIANAYAEAFIADSLDRRYDATSYARKFLEDRLAQLKVKLQDSEKQLVKYAEQQGIINLDNNQSLAASDLQAINGKLADAHNARLEAEAKWKQAETADGMGIKEILESKTIQDLMGSRAQLSAQYQQKLAVFKPAFPEMVSLRSQIKELDRQIQAEVAAIKDSIRSSYFAAKSQEDELRAALEETKANVSDQRSRSIQYNILQREVDTNRTLYDGLLQRYKEIGVSGAVGTNNVSIIDAAQKPTVPVSPNLPRNLAMALVAGLLIGLVTAFGLDYLDDSFKSPEEVEREIGLPVIGVIPKPAAGSSLDEELRHSRSGMSEAFRSLRTGLQFATNEGLPKLLLITSSRPSEGKTTTSISLAKSLTHLGLNVLLIDGDLRNAAIHKRLKCTNEKGLSNILIGADHPEDVVQATDTDGLTLISSGPLPPNPAELIAGPRFQQFMALATEAFDTVIIDGPPVMGLADSPLLATQVQATILVVAAHETRRSVVKVALRRLQMARANMIGALLSKFDVKQTGYGYGYGYGDYDYHSYGSKELPAPIKGS